jgi:hypothetical protein
VPDLQQQQEIEMQKHAEEEEKRDMTWEEFLQQYEQHIEGKVDPTIRTANRAGDEDEVAQKVDPSVDESKSKFTSVESGQKSKQASREAANKGRSVSELSAKYDIPNECKLELLKNARIQKLDENYLLIAHPYP